MTNTLIVNCSLKTTANKPLVDAVEKFSNYETIPFREIDEAYKINDKVDTLVLSGSAARVVNPTHREMYAGTINLIKSCNLPVLGICFGHQLLCWTLGAEVGSLNEPVLDRFEKVRIIENDPIFEALPQSKPAFLAESHYDYVLKESLSLGGFQLLADSESCPVEAVKHKKKQIYGVQFHPERTNLKKESHDDGRLIIQSYYTNIVKR